VAHERPSSRNSIEKIDNDACIDRPDQDCPNLSRAPREYAVVTQEQTMNLVTAAELGIYRGPTDFEARQMIATETYRYRGYDIVPMWQWSSWCAGIYSTRAELPILSQSTLSTMASKKEEAVAEAKHCIDDILSR
jgi:hypothetical protein